MVCGGGDGAGIEGIDAGPSIIVSIAPDDATTGTVVTANDAGAWMTPVAADVGGGGGADAGGGAAAIMVRLGLIGGNGRGRAREKPSSALQPDVVAVVARGAKLRGGGFGAFGVFDTATAFTVQPLATTANGPFGVQVFRAACPCQFICNKFNYTTKVVHICHTNPQLFLNFDFFVLIRCVGRGGKGGGSGRTSTCVGFFWI